VDDDDDDDEHQDLRTNHFQDPNPSLGPSPLKGPITQSMMRNIQEGQDQKEPNKLHGLQYFSLGLKIISKYDWLQLYQ